MILNSRKWLCFERNLKKHEEVNVENNFRILDALYKEAVALKVLPLKDSLEGLDAKIKIAKAVNYVSAAPHKTSR